MRRSIVALLTIAGVTLVVPASASGYGYLGGCDFDGAHVAPVTGQVYEGVFRALVVLDNGDVGPISVSCAITVNGVFASAMPTATGTMVAAGTGSGWYAAGDTDVVRLCETVEHSRGRVGHCRVLPRVQVPPQEVVDLADLARNEVKTLVDPPLCDLLREVQGQWGPLYVNEQGDVYLGGAPMHDCPPYDVEGGPALPPDPDVLSQVVSQLDETLCDVLRAFSGSTGPFTVGTDGDLYFGGDKVYDCPGVGPVAPSQGWITVTDQGAGPVAAAGGVFATPDWSCGDAEPLGDGRIRVTCDYLGWFLQPECAEANALAVSLPPYAVGTSLVRTMAICVGSLLAEFVQTDLAHPGQPVTFAERDNLVRQPVDEVHCLLDDGAGQAPAPSYAAVCGFGFR